MVAAATVLGMFGCIGLVVAALPITYRTPLLRHAAMFGLAAGFFAWIVIAFWVLMAFSVTIGEPRDGINGDNGVYVQAFVMVLLVWPCIAGVIAIRDLGRASGTDQN